MTVVPRFASLMLGSLMVLAGACSGEGGEDTAPIATTSSSTITTTSTTVARTSTTVAVTTTTAQSTTTPGRAPGGGGAIAICRDGTLSYAVDHEKECSSHGGVADLRVQ